MQGVSRVVPCCDDIEDDGDGDGDVDEVQVMMFLMLIFTRRTNYRAPSFTHHVTIAT